MTFRRQLIIKSFLPDAMSALLIFMYTAITLQLSVEAILKTGLVIFIIFLLFQFSVAIVTDMAVYKGISERMHFFLTKETTIEERTELLEEIHHLPFITAIMTFLYFFAGEIIVLSFFILKFKFSISMIIIISMQFACAAFMAALFGDNYCRKICNEYAVKIVSAGVDKDYVKEKKYFGNPILIELLLFVILPLLFTTIISCAILIFGYFPLSKPALWQPAKIQIDRMFWTSILNIIIECTLIIFFYLRIYKVNSKMTKTLDSILNAEIDKFQLLESDLSNEHSYSNYLLNQLIEHFKNILTKTTKIGNELNNLGNLLATVSNESETTTVEQSKGTKEILTTMVKLSELSKEIESQIEEVSDFAGSTFDKVSEGIKLLNKNIEKINQISFSNKENVTAIKELNSKISKIWEVTNMINVIADQTKIVAFNAELEANNIKDEKRNFKNLSSEIRKLANSTIDSTTIIKNKISEFQNYSNSIINDSQKSIKEINQGANLTDSIEERFSTIKNSSKENALSASEIKNLINQENLAFNQIVKTLEQINFSILDFSVSTKNIIDTTYQLQENAEVLKKLTENKENDYEI